MQCLLDLLYAGRSLQGKKFEKRERNAEIYLWGSDNSSVAVFPLRLPSGSHGVSRPKLVGR
jgi:hypothetical protein